MDTDKEYAYSTNGEHFYGSYGSIEEALEACKDENPDETQCEIGERFDPPKPEEMWDTEHWLEHVACQDEYTGDWADDWYDAPTDEQKAELREDVQKIMAMWLKKHNLRPTFFIVPKSETYQIERSRLDELVEQSHNLPEDVIDDARFPNAPQPQQGETEE